MVNSSVTPAQPVDRSANVSVFAEVLDVASDAAFSYTGQRELEGLKKKFGNIAQARAQGGKSSALQAKARAALDEAKANSPWIAQQADKLFQTSFGGGGSGGTFSKTPQEKAEEEYLQQVTGKALQLGVSNEEAAKRISMEENAATAKVLADSQKDVREYNGEVVFANTQVQLNTRTVQFMDALKRGMTNGGGSLSLDDKRSLEFAVSSQAASLKAELSSQVRDPNTGHLLIGKAEYDSSLKEIEDWVENSKQLVGDSSYLKVIQDVNTANQAEVQVLASKQYPTLKILNAAGGQAAVQTYIEASKRPEGASKQILIGSHPVVADMFKQQGSFNQAAMTGIDKLVVPKDTFSAISEPEAYAAGTMLNDPRNAKLTETVVEKAATEADSARGLEGIVQKNPDSSAMIWSDRYKAWAQANTGKAERVNSTVLGGLKKGFLSTYAADNSALPSSFSIGTAPKPTSKLASSKQRAPKLNTISGEGITKESATFLRNILSVYSKNPAELEKARKESGVSDLTPQEAVPYFVLGTLPERFSNNNSDKSNRKTDNVDGFTGASTPQADPKKKLDDSDIRGIDSQAMSNFVKKAVELNWTEDDVTVFMDDLGLADNEQTQSIKKKIAEAMKKKGE